MITKLVKRGNSRALIIPAAILKLLGWDKDDEIKITTDGKGLRLTKHEPPINKN